MSSKCGYIIALLIVILWSEHMFTSSLIENISHIIFKALGTCYKLFLLRKNVLYAAMMPMMHGNNCDRDPV